MPKKTPADLSELVRPVPWRVKAQPRPKHAMVGIAVEQKRDGFAFPESVARQTLRLRADKLGDPRAMYQLGLVFLDSGPADCDTEEAARWLTRAANAGHSVAKCRLLELSSRTEEQPAATSREGAPEAAIAAAMTAGGADSVGTSPPKAADPKSLE